MPRICDAIGLGEARILGVLAGRLYLYIFGWKLVGQFTNLNKCILIFAYHTSNWDFSLCMALRLGLNTRVNWLAKKSIFIWPFGAILRAIGGIPVDRSHKLDFVSQVVAQTRARDYFVLAMAPEGTRKKVNRWKSGFYYISLNAGIPIQPVAYDYKNKSVVFGEVFKPTGNFQADLEYLKEFFRPYEPKYPELADKDFLTGEDDQRSLKAVK